MQRQNARKRHNKTAALKDGKLVPTTFVAELVDKTYAITFDANTPLGTDVKGLSSPVTVKHGQRAQILSDTTLSRSGYKFTGEWSDDKDGEGALYNAGTIIKHVFSDITLYAQWKEVATFDDKKQGTQPTFSCTPKEVDSSDDLLECKAAASL